MQDKELEEFFIKQSHFNKKTLWQQFKEFFIKLFKKQ